MLFVFDEQKQTKKKYSRFTVQIYKYIKYNKIK